ncbi:glycosyltransferase family 2 protein [Pseudoflavitalea rhizosphaerae]|uniref:glycosyltransferase family 2 protein n=1 Tax=Pseudoflavitalea rhizosphaerae TaxID=1884793 RepID=UPI000F8CEA16|nr:glycosyltransferase family 2 protein [Pseudoflavitalea rhizosphaerae]
MRLSVIIVNYNVKYFLEQCLCSVMKAIAALGEAAAEVIVVDNQSTDGSVEYLRPKFPSVFFIENRGNSGFGRANNQAVQMSKGEFILFLNPDTIVEENSFTGCLAEMQRQPDLGAMGIRMVDGGGKYLPESKRGFPTPWVSFCKLSGLTKLFPASRMFARYYLGHLQEKESNEVDVLAGACMLVRRKAIELTGGFDERFFMYAEDIDLSFRIKKAGFRNFYFTGTTIIHFKGESTLKDARYVRHFYEAMILYVRKHYKGIGAWSYVQLLKAMIAIRSVLQSSPAVPKGLSKDQSIAVTGDPDTVKRIVRGLGEQQVTNQPQQADVLICCEGADFTFRELIGKIEELAPGKRAFVHGSGTECAVGSASKDRQGEVILLKLPPESI